MRNGKWKKLCVVFMAFFAIVIFCSCSCSCSEEPELEISVNSLVLSTDAGNGLSVRKNQQFTISYTTTPTNAEVPGVYISSSNSLCVMVINDEMDESHGEARFQATGVGKSTITFISKDGGHKKTCEVSVYEPTVLETPTNISFDGTKLVWDESDKDVNGADRLCNERYNVSITSDGTTKKFTVEDNQLLSSTLFTFETEKNYSVSVQAIGDNIKNSDSQNSAVYQFYILGAPRYTVRNGDIEWYFIQSETSKNNPNFYKVQYNEAGDYVVVANPNSRASDNKYMFSENLLDINDFFVSIQPIKAPAQTTVADVKALIDEADVNGSAIHGVVNGIDYISIKKTNSFALHRTLAVTNVSLDNSALGDLKINGIDFENAYQPSVLRFEGENEYYLGRIKYKLTFRNTNNGKVVTIPLELGVTEYPLDDDFIENVVNVIGETPQVVGGMIAYNLSTYSVTIQPEHATNEAVSSIIIGPSSAAYTFTYFNVPIDMIEVEVDAKNAILTYKNPTHKDATYFENLQFIFVNPTSVEKDYKIVIPETDKVDLKEALQGLQGSYQIWINLKGLSNANNNLGTMNILGKKFQSSGGEPEVIETISAPTGLKLLTNGTILWNRVEGAKEYRVELRINEATTYSEVVADGENGNTYNLHTLLENWNSNYDDLTVGVDYEIRVVSIAEKEGVIDSASDALVFQKLNQVQNLSYSNGVVSWDALSGVSKYMVSVNNGTAVEVNPQTLSQNIYADDRLSTSIYADASMKNTISVWAIGAEDAGRLDSVPSSIEVSKSQAPNLSRVLNGRVYWETLGVEGDLYKVRILTEDNRAFAEIDGITGNFFDLSIIESTENLKISVTRYSENTFESSDSNVVNFRRLISPNLSVVERNGNFYLSWSKNEDAVRYQITGLKDSAIIIEKSEEASYLNTETNCYEYKLTDIDETKKYYVSIIAQAEAEYLVEIGSSAYALVASRSVGISFAKLPKVKFSVEDKRILWGFSDWALYDEYFSRRSEFNYSLVISNSLDEEVFNEQRLTFNQNRYEFTELPADTYNIDLILKSAITSQNSSDYIIYSDISNIEITKLNTVELGIKEGKIVFDRTVEGIKSTDYSLYCDFYSIFADGIKLTNDEYIIEQNEETGQMMITLTSLIGSETSYSVVVRRTKEISGDKFFVDSDESTKLMAKNINVENFAKVGNNFEFEPAILVDGEDVAESYIIEGHHATSSGYSFYQLIEAGDENYFIDGKYVVPVGALSAGAGEYVFNIKVVGQEIITGDTKIAYLGDAEGKTISVIVLNNPSDSQVVIENGIINLIEYIGASDSELDVPNKVAVTFEKFNSESLVFETYGSIELEYENLKFVGKKYDLGISESYLEAGEYKVYVEFLGDGDHVISSAKMQGNRGGTVSKIESTSIFVFGGELCWKEISGASYRLFFDGEEEFTEITTNSEEVVIENNVVTLNTRSWEAGRKVLKIQVVKDGSLPSNESEEFVVIKLNAMEIKADNDDGGAKILSWDNVLEGATNQLIYLDEDVIDKVGTNNSSWVITSNQEVGVHSFSMISKGSIDTRLDDEKIGYLTSDASNAVSIQFIEPTVVTSLKNGIAQWAEIKGVLTYEIALYKPTGYPDVKELVSAGTITSTNKTSFDLNEFEIVSGNYVLEVKVASIDPLSEIMNSSHEEIETNFLRILKIDEFGDYSIYSDLRVENGMFAFDITSNYLESYKSLLKTINPEVENYDDLTLESVVEVINDEATEETKQILYSLVNFNARINGKVLTNLKPSSYNLMLEEGYLTLYYNINLGSNTYEIEFSPIGNSCSSKDEVVLGVLNGEPTEIISAVKPDKPVCPVLYESENSIVKGVLIWSAPTGFEGNYIIEFKEVATETIKTKVISIVEELTEDEIWEAIVIDGKIQLDLNKAVNAGELKQGVEYVISIHTEGTANSKQIELTETKYLTGVKNTLARTFISLEAPSSFRANGGDIYWTSVESAIGYELYFYGYNSADSEYNLEIAEHQALYFENSINKYNVIDNENLPAGRYMVGIKAKGDGNYKIDSPVVYAYFVKAGNVKVYVENGYFAFDELSYNAIDSQTGELTGSVNNITSYSVRIQERNSGIGNTEHDWLTERELRKIGSKYYFELPDELKDSISDYKLEVYARGNNSYLLSGDIASSLYFAKSEIPVGFDLDKNGLISWTDSEDYYAVYVRPTGGSAVRVDFDGDDYTSSNSFNINTYASSLGKYGEYEIYIKALHKNPTNIDNQRATNTKLISSKSEIIKLNVIAPPIIKLDSGDINWQSDSFASIQEEITSSYLIIKGKIIINGLLTETEQTIKVKCSSSSPLFVNDYYSARYVEESNESYYLIDLVQGTQTNTKVTLDGGENYSISVHYIGHTGDVKEGETYLCSSMSSTAVSEVGCLEIPTGLTGATNEEVEEFDYENYIKWNKDANATGYEVMVYSLDGDEKAEEFGSFNSIDNPKLFKAFEDFEFFAMDSIIEEFALHQYLDRMISVKVKAIGSTWTGFGSKKISSNYSELLNIKYPVAPTEFAYNGAGLISWRNNASGTIKIEVTYVVNECYADSNNQYPDYDVRGKGLNYSEIERKTDGLDDVVIAVDTITLTGAVDGTKGMYQLKYLTEDIKSIKIWVETVNFVSIENVLDSTGDNPELSLQTKNFMLFSGGDGSIVDPFKITNETDFRNISHYLDSHFVIIDDIALTSDIQPIGSKSTTVNTAYAGSAKAFAGTINGDILGTNAKITNVRLEADDETDASAYFFGLFYSVAEGASISNVDIQFAYGESSISAANRVSYVGGLVANENHGTINHVNTSGNIYIAGATDNYALTNVIHISSIANKNYGVITGSTLGAISETSLVVTTDTASYVGGISYYNYGTISYYGVEGATLKGSSVGGIAHTNAGTIENSFAKTNIIVNGGGSEGYTSPRFAGGIAGIQSTATSATAPCMITKSYSETNITVENMAVTCYVGGLVGQTQGGSISNVYVSLYSNDGTTQGGTTATIGKVYGYFLGATGSNIYYHANNLGNHVAGKSIAGNSGIGNELGITSPSSSLSLLNSNGEVFVQDGSNIKLAWEK